MARPNLRNHRKFRRLVAILGIPEPHVLGHLELLWASAYENGDAFLGDSTDLELAAMWKGEPGELTRALQDCGGVGHIGFIEPTDDGFAVHDLWDHAPEYVQKRRKRELDRKTLGAELAKSNPTGGQRRTKSAEWRTSADGDAPPAPAPAPAPAQMKGTPKISASEYPPDFESFWNAYPKARRLGKVAAYKTWQSELEGGKSQEQIIHAAKNYDSQCRDDKVEEKYIKHPERFLKDGFWEGLLDYAPKSEEASSQSIWWGWNYEKLF